jgi:nitrogen fixation protein FixH
MNKLHHLTTHRWNPWPISIIAFFSVAILGCGTFVAFCSRHPADLISPNYYEDEVRYQAQIDRVKLTAQQAPEASVSYDTATKQVKLSLGSAPPGTKTSGTIVLFRPSAQNLDRQLELNVNAQGEQILDGASLLPGLWRVRVSWAIADHQYFMDQQIVVPATSS